MPTAPRISRSSPRPGHTRSRELARFRAASAGPPDRRAALFHDHLARLEREDGAPRIVVHELATGEEHRIAFDAETYFLGFETVYEFDTPVMRFGFSSMRKPKEIYDYDMAMRQRTLRKRQMSPKGLRILGLCHAPHLRARADGERCRYRSCTGGHAARRHGAAARLRLRRLWPCHRRLLLDQSAVARRSRLRLCDRPCPRRNRQGLALVQGGQARAQDQHVLRLHRRDPPPRRPGLRRRRPRRRPRRQRRRHADGRDRQSGARTLRGHHRRRALRRRARHHARPGAAADAARMAGMGQSDSRPGSLRDDSRLQPLRQYPRASPIPRFSRWRASPIRASPIGSRPNGSPGCARR